MDLLPHFAGQVQFMMIAATSSALTPTPWLLERLTQATRP